MVFFTCSACGASLKKNQVEKHCTNKCRHCEYLTCIDCLKDFPGDTYISHTKCMTENERYGGQNYVPKVNKNENKQLQWVENVHKLVEESPSLDSDVRSLLQSIVKHENIPRRKSKFINFIKNVNKRVLSKTVEKTWELFEEALKSKKEPPPTQNGETQNAQSNGHLKKNKSKKTSEKKSSDAEMSSEGSTEKEKRDKKMKKKSKKCKKEDGSNEGTSIPIVEDKGLKSKAGKKRKRGENDDKENSGKGSKEEEESSDKSSKKKSNKKNSKKNVSNVESSNPLAEFKGSSFYETPSKKRKHEENEEEEISSPPKKVPKFDWEGTITTLLERKGGSLSLKKVKKKILAEYECQVGSSHKSQEDLLSKLNKKLNKNKKFKVLKDQVTLVSQ